MTNTGWPALITLLLLSSRLEGALIASSKLEQCINRGSSASCEQKFTVALSLNGGQNNTESVAYWRTAVDSSNEPVILTHPVKIAVAKSVPLIRYRVYYQQSFNAKPYEDVAYTSSFKCEDDASSSDPTCGRGYDATATAIPFSEGYCCSCSFCELFGFCSGDSRANTNCALFGDGAAASCLRFGELWYSGYTVGPAETWYQISITITQQTSSHTTTLNLGPDSLGAQDEQFGITARLIGDYAAFKEPKNMEDKFLFVPSAPRTHVRAIAPVPQEWMLIDKYHTTPDGSQCNKIGVSYKGFNSQGSRCKLTVGSCTQSQLEDFRAQDVERARKGKTQQYMVSSFGDFSAYSQQTSPASRRRENKLNAPHMERLRNTTDFLAATQFRTSSLGHQAQKSERRIGKETSTGSNTRVYLAYEVDTVQSTLITLTFAASNISFTTNVASGEIVSLYIPDFEAGSREGHMTVTVLNTGSIHADFYVRVELCTVGTAPVQSQVSSIRPFESRKLEFNIAGENVLGQRNVCNVTLLDSLFHVLDSRQINFTTTDTRIDRGAQGGSGSQPVGGPITPRSVEHSDGEISCTDCPWYNPVCFLLKRCFWQIVLTVALILFILFLIFLLIRHRRTVFAPCIAAASRQEGEESSRKKRMRFEEEGRCEESSREEDYPPPRQYRTGMREADNFTSRRSPSSTSGRPYYDWHAAHVPFEEAKSPSKHSKHFHRERHSRAPY